MAGDNEHGIRAGGVTPYFAAGQDFVLFEGDCRAILPTLPEDSVDTVFADPPYFLSGGGITCQAGRMVSVNKGEWDRATSIEEVHEFNLAWLGACRRVMQKDATIWVSGTAHNIFSIGYAMQQLGFRILNDIVWRKGNPPPNLGRRCFTHATEWVIWAAKSRQSRHTFHYEEMKRLAGGRQMKNVWEINAPRNSEKVLGKHPTQKPLALLDRIIRASTNEGAVVLDPFCGSGTTGLAAYRLRRRFIGIDSDADFLRLAAARFRSELPSLPFTQAQKRTEAQPMLFGGGPTKKGGS